MSEIKEMPLVELTAKDLPAYCPNPAMARWSAHPRVFIDVSHGEARCRTAARATSCVTARSSRATEPGGRACRLMQARRPPRRRSRIAGAPPFSILATRTRRLSAVLHYDIGSRPDASSAGYRTELDR